MEIHLVLGGERGRCCDRHRFVEVPALGFCEQCGEDVGLVELSPGGPARLVAHVHRERGAICIGSGRRASVLRRPATRS